MKRCPTCEKTFDDSMRFCQSDGTALIEAAEPVDPYKTMVARSEDIAAAIPPLTPEEPVKEEKPIAVPKTEDEVLQLPDQADPMRTMYVSEAEIRKEMSSPSTQDVIDIPPLKDSPTPEPPKFLSEDLKPPTSTGTPPPSPFSSDSAPPQPPPREPVREIPSQPKDNDVSRPMNPTAPAIPSPFNEPKAPVSPVKPEPKYSQPPRAAAGQFNKEPAKAEWTPPPPPNSWEPPAVAGGSGSTPAAAGAPGQNKTLAFVSLVLALLSFVCLGPLGSIGAVITGIMQRGKIKRDPSGFGGGGLALAGILLGVLSAVLWVVAILVYGYIIYSGTKF